MTHERQHAVVAFSTNVNLFREVTENIRFSGFIAGP